ncbi:MAG: peptidoglycan DD-metalloendopeptidase family protein [Deltaproteobacteria bacterium]|nr:peptidoglycan DD-metalloendopeptidase family protein [Deltaproteobacteria bacterium]
MSSTVFSENDFLSLGLLASAEDKKFLGSTSLLGSDFILNEWHQLVPWVSPVVPRGAFEVFDFTSGYAAERKLKFDFGLGRYDEDRVGMYNADFFNGKDPVARRTIHMGLDLGAPAGTPVFSPVAAKLWGVNFLEREGDYGGTIILECQPPDQLRCPTLYMLFGHLAKDSLRHIQTFAEIQCGDLVGWLGEPSENGGWNPHLHWQLSWSRPLKIDLPGAVSALYRDKAKSVFPDPTASLSRAIGGWRGL